MARILDNENAEIGVFPPLGTTGLVTVGAFSGAATSVFTGSGVTGIEVTSFFSTGVLTSVIEKVGFL
ncbi:hypothetical protein OIU83_14740 [Flavobacterium sp. LS1R49]|uniref:Uncharacterized protein n=1 Tax=Flavobacterium shii TaxID=2987687 RepID=A0A9X2ZHQ6_9FLAO|nr:hypothetical protein [Flavobacterium shii]MCV9928926.1 hypothetical protein [Flavobacterium shii]